MSDPKNIEQMFQEAQRVARWTDALFGYVYDLNIDGDNFTRGRPLVGLITEENTLKRYYKTVGERAIDLIKRETDEAMHVSVQNAAGEAELPWFAAILTQQLKLSCCLAFIYPFISEHESIRTLRFLQLIFQDLPPAYQVGGRLS